MLENEAQLLTRITGKTLPGYSFQDFYRYSLEDWIDLERREGPAIARVLRSAIELSYRMESETCRK